MTAAQASGEIDGVGLALLTRRFDGIVAAMVNTLVRTGRSGVLNTGRDFSCCILTGDSRLLNIGASLPVHVMCGPDMMAESMVDLHPELRRGDAFLHNSPYLGNSHAADHSILVPVMDEEGRHRFTVFAKAHQADCGNAQPTTYAATARDVYEEGALIFPCVQIQRDYADVEDIVRMCKARIRVPEQWWGDYLALLGATRVGERRIGELATEIGWDAIDDYVEKWLDYSERRMGVAIGKLPGGTIVAETAHDPFPAVPDGVELRAVVTVSPEEGVIDLDLTDNPDCVPCGLNLTEATSRTAAIIGTLNSLDSTVPANAGSLRRLRTHLRENCVVGIPRHPTSCSVATSNLMDRIANAVQRAFAELDDGIGLAEAGLPVPPAFAVISGRDRRDAVERPFVNQLVLPSVTGGPAAPETDGWLTFCSAGSAGLMLRDSVELDELRYPLRIEEQSLIPDSEGAGRTRGAFAARCRYTPAGGELEIMYNSDGCVGPAQGARGGGAGAPAAQFLSSGATLTELDPCGQAEVDDGEVVVSISCGGGGYGDPRERDPERVLHDHREGLVSRERAEDVYGVAIDADGRGDGAATARLRGTEAR